jgi:hypothetical protein
MSKVKDALCVEYGEFDVSIDRDKYIGGSDIPVILGISKFKTRWQLLLEKAGLEESTFTGNRFTEYGHYIEPFIRDHINLTYNTQFIPNRVIDGDIRCHTDGFNGDCVLEIKSTSDIHSTVDGYKSYLSQLVKYMEENDVQRGILAVYDRPEDFSPDFDATRLQVFEIVLDDYRNLLNHVNKELDKFREDLERLKENPLLTEQDFLPAGELAVLADKVAKFENQLAAMKEIENQCKEAKKQLYMEMVKRGVKSWAMPNGTKITRVDEVPGTEKLVMELDTEALKRERPDVFAGFCREVVKKVAGKSGYVKITVK